jgi:hypothetical protein
MRDCHEAPERPQLELFSVCRAWGPREVADFKPSGRTSGRASTSASALGGFKPLAMVTALSPIEHWPSGSVRTATAHHKPHPMIAVCIPKGPSKPQRRPFPFGLKAACCVGVKGMIRPIKPERVSACRYGGPPTANAPATSRWKASHPSAMIQSSACRSQRADQSGSTRRSSSRSTVSYTTDWDTIVPSASPAIRLGLFSR